MRPLENLPTLRGRCRTSLRATYSATASRTSLGRGDAPYACQNLQAAIVTGLEIERRLLAWHVSTIYGITSSLARIQCAARRGAADRNTYPSLETRAGSIRDARNAGIQPASARRRSNGAVGMVLGRVRAARGRGRSARNVIATPECTPVSDAVRFLISSDSDRVAARRLSDVNEGAVGFCSNGMYIVGGTPRTRNSGRSSIRRRRIPSGRPAQVESCARPGEGAIE